LSVSTHGAEAADDPNGQGPTGDPPT